MDTIGLPGPYSPGESRGPGPSEKESPGNLHYDLPATLKGRKKDKQKGPE
jgi:hypothetical protein